MAYFAFVKYGYEDEEVIEKDSREEMEDWLIVNEESVCNKALVHCVIKGENVPFEIVKKETKISWGV